MRWLARRVCVQSIQSKLGGFLMLVGGVLTLAAT